MDSPARANEGSDHVALVQRVARGDRDAYARLYDLFAPRVFGLILKIIGPAARSEAEDILQDVMFELWRNAPKYHPDSGSVSTWVLLIARSRTIDHLRRNQSYQQATSAAVQARSPGLSSRGAADGIPADFERTLSDLPEEQRTVFNLAFARGMTREQIASSLDLPVGTVKTRVRAAILRLASLASDLSRDGRRG